MDQTAEPVQTPPPPATIIPAATIIPVIPEIPTTISDVTTAFPTVPPAASLEADPTDVSEINFSYYSDSDFSMYYPSAWNVSKSYYTPYICKSVLDPLRTDYRLCYRNETASIGPFIFSDSDIYKKPYRVVTFTSPDRTLKSAALIKDYIDGRTGIYRLNPTIEWSKSLVEANYPDLSASEYIRNYKYFSGGNTMTATYDVILPAHSDYTPSAYTTKTFVTTHHLYEFGFFTDAGNFSNYQDLKEKMISSIKITDS